MMKYIVNKVLLALVLLTGCLAVQAQNISNKLWQDSKETISTPTAAASYSMKVCTIGLVSTVPRKVSPPKWE